MVNNVIILTHSLSRNAYFMQGNAVCVFYNHNLTYRLIKGVGNLKEKSEIPQFLTAKFIQDYLSVSKSKVYRMFDTGELPAINIGRSRRVKREDFIKWLDDNEPKEVNHA